MIITVMEGNNEVYYGDADEFIMQIDDAELELALNELCYLDSIKVMGYTITKENYSLLD